MYPRLLSNWEWSFRLTPPHKYWDYNVNHLPWFDNVPKSSFSRSEKIKRCEVGATIHPFFTLFISSSLFLFSLIPFIPPNMTFYARKYNLTTMLHIFQKQIRIFTQEEITLWSHDMFSLESHKKLNIFHYISFPMLIFLPQSNDSFIID